MIYLLQMVNQKSIIYFDAFANWTSVDNGFSHEFPTELVQALVGLLLHRRTGLVLFVPLRWNGVERLFETLIFIAVWKANMDTPSGWWFNGD